MRASPIAHWSTPLTGFVDIDLDTIGLALGVLGLIGLSNIYAAYTGGRRWSRIYRSLRLRPRQPVDIVLTTTTTVERGAERKYVRHTTSEGNLDAATTFSSRIGTLRLRKDVEIHLSERIKGKLINDLILVGGPDRNDFSNRFLTKLTEAYPDVPFEWDDIAGTKAKIRLGEYTTEYDCVFQEKHPGVPENDFALLVMWVNPFVDEKRRAILCCGMTSHGTAAAAHYLIEKVLVRHGRYPGSSLKLGLWKRLRRRWPCFAMVIEMNLDGEQVYGDPVEHAVVELSDVKQRPK